MSKMSERLARNGVLIALLTVLLFLARFRFFRLSSLVAASLVMVGAMILQGVKESVVIYLLTSLFTLLVFPSAAAFSFFVFFGFYPLFKAYLENQKKLWSFAWPAKLTYFFLVFFLSRYVLWSFFPGLWIYSSRVSVFSIPMAILFDLALSLVSPYLDQYLKLYRLR